MGELKARFPEQHVLNALGVVYPQYWANGGGLDTFNKHLEILKGFYCEPKWIDDGTEGSKGRKLVSRLLDSWKLESQQGMFKTAMQSNWQLALEPPFTCNPLTKLWRILDGNSLTQHLFSEYLKLAEISLVHVIGSVEDERTFSTLSFLKNKLRNALNEHLPLVVGMYSQKLYTLDSFPYQAAFEKWLAGAKRYGRYGLTA